MMAFSGMGGRMLFEGVAAVTMKSLDDEFLMMGECGKIAWERLRCVDPSVGP